MWIEFNANPIGKHVGDCAIRAISKVLNEPWGKIYLDVIMHGYMMCDMPSSNTVWGAYMTSQGFIKRLIPDELPTGYTVKDFCEEHPIGVFLLVLNGHVVAVCDGDYYDTFDVGNEYPIYYFERC